MAGTLQANNKDNINPSNTGSPKKQNSSFNDLSMAGLFPSASAEENVSGANGFSSQRYGVRGGVDPIAPAPVPGAAPLDVSQVDLGSEQWEEIQLAKAIEQLREQYAQLAAKNGGSLQDPYWQNEYNNAVQEQADSIRSQSATDRATREEAEANRQLTEREGLAQREATALEGGQNREASRDIANLETKAAEQGAQWQGLASLGGQALFNKPAPVESRLIPGSVEPILDKDGKMIGIKNNPPTEGKTPEQPKSAFDKLIDFGKNSFNSSGLFKGETPVNKFSSYATPAVLGTGVGMMLPNSKKGNAGLQALGGLTGTAANALINKASPWGNLVSSAGMAWANPFNKGSWGKRTGDTLLKMGGSLLAGRLFGGR